MKRCKHTIYIILTLFVHFSVSGKDYYVHPEKGNDNNKGTSKKIPFRSLNSLNLLKLKAGDRIFLAAGLEHMGQIRFMNVLGSKNKPVTLTTYPKSKKNQKAIINAEAYSEGILIQNSAYINIDNIEIIADGFITKPNDQAKMKCGVLLLNKNAEQTHHINLSSLYIHHIFYEKNGFVRSPKEVKTPNGTQKYGWGLRMITTSPEANINDITIDKCTIENVSHTGLKLTGKLKNIFNIHILNNQLYKTGGPGIQMSGTKEVYVAHNKVSYSGDKSDMRKWGRGSGLWTWGSSKILIEKNQFLHANGPADSAGAHIDFNCSDVIIQYNLSAFNAGGFCEILGNNYNCAYRYNISYNDGHRVKGRNGAFQEGKTLWLSGFRGKKNKRKGPYQSYIYNNTVITDSSITNKIALDKRSNGLLIANNIFCFRGTSKQVTGDQYRPDKESNQYIKNVFFKNNLFLRSDNWPKEIQVKDSAPIFGDPMFKKITELNIENFIPNNTKLIKNKGIFIKKLENDPKGLFLPFTLDTDILGNPIKEKPPLGAIQI